MLRLCKSHRKGVFNFFLFSFYGALSVRMTVTKWVLPVVVVLCVVDLIWSISPLALLYLSCFVAGSLAMLAWLTHHQPAYHTSTAHPSVGIPVVLEKCCSETAAGRKQDTRITGSSAIDQQLQKAMSFILRDYVESWYHKHVTLDSDFIAQTRLSAQSALRVLAAQCKSADWLNLLTLQLTDELIQHFKMYRQACDVLVEKEAVVEEGSSSPVEGKELDLVFFDLESGLAHSKVMGKLCSDEEREKVYLDSVTEMLLYIVLPEEDFHNTALRYLLKDVLSVQVLQPLVNTLCEPDFVNRLFIAYLKENTLNPESFQAAIRTCSSVEELQELEQFTEEEIAKIRRTGSSEEDHQQLTSTQFILQMLQKEKEKLEQATEGGVEEGVVPECLSPTFSDAELKRTGLPMLLRGEITDHSVAESEGPSPSAPPTILYHIKVSCRHNGGQAESWNVQRKIEDFRVLHCCVEQQIGPGLVSFPKLKDADSTRPAKQEQCCRLLEQLLCRLLVPDLLVEYPDLLGTMVQFLAMDSYSLQAPPSSQPPPLLQPDQQSRGRSDSSGSTGSRDYPGSQTTPASTRANQPQPDLRKDPVEKLKHQSGVAGGATGERYSPVLPRQRPSKEEGSGSGEEGVTALHFDEDDDSVPLRVLMILADEVFDLKKQNQWFRRGFTVTVQELIRATFGDRLSYKIVNYMNKMTTSEQIAEYLESTINYIWPDGHPSTEAGSRDDAMQLRTKMVARAKLLGTVPDDLRRIIGTNTSHFGMARVFEMFQHKRLNRRLIYCLLEQLIVTVFHENVQLADTLRTLRGA